MTDPYAPNAGTAPIARTDASGHAERTQRPYSFSWAEDGGARKTQTIMAYDDEHAAEVVAIWIERTRQVDEDHPNGRGASKTARLLSGPVRVK